MLLCPAHMVHNVFQKFEDGSEIISKDTCLNSECYVCMRVCGVGDLSFLFEYDNRIWMSRPYIKAPFG